MDLDTFMTTLYVLIDDWYKSDISHLMKRHAGPAVQMSDSEVLTVAIAGQWQTGMPWRSERGLVRYMQQHGRHWFPGMLDRSQFNQRVRDLWAALVRLQQLIAQGLTVGDLYECVDCTPLPHCSLAQAASHTRHWLSGHLGYGGNNGGWYFGEQVLVSVSAAGVVTGWVVGQAQIDDRWMLEAFLSTRQDHMRLSGPEQTDHKRTQPAQVATPESFSPAIAAGRANHVPYLADEGFNGARWIDHWQTEYAATVIAAPPTNAPRLWSRADKQWLAHHRQIVETVFARLSDVFRLKRLEAHSDWGKLTRLAATMAAYNIGIWINRMLHRPDGALATLVV
jgi:hypothetical protein